MSDFRDIDLNVARTRIILSVVGFVSVYIDPSTAGIFKLTRAEAMVLGIHLAYSTIVYLADLRRPSPIVAASITVALDLAFATAVAFCTEGQTSPAYIFFVFAIIAIGIRRPFRTTIGVTAASVLLYLAVIWIAQPMTGFYVMRGVYVPAGSHTVDFRFEPPIGTQYVSWIAVMIGVVLLGFVSLRGRQGLPSQPSKDSSSTTHVRRSE